MHFYMDTAEDCYRETWPVVFDDPMRPVGLGEQARYMCQRLILQNISRIEDAAKALGWGSWYIWIIATRDADWWLQRDLRSLSDLAWGFGQRLSFDFRHMD